MMHVTKIQGTTCHKDIYTGQIWGNFSINMNNKKNKKIIAHNLLNKIKICKFKLIYINKYMLTRGYCEKLSFGLNSSETLRRLNLNQKTLDPSGVVLLCEALRHTEYVL